MVSIIIIGSLMFGSMALLGLVGLAAEQLAEKELQRESNGNKSRGRHKKNLSKTVWKQLSGQQKGNTNQSPAPEFFETGPKRQNGKRYA